MRLQTAGPILAILASATIAVAGTATPAAGQRAPLPAQAANSPDWMEPFEPFRIADNLYYVGTRGLANYLVTTPQGHILVNSDLEENVPMIRASVEKLGFKFSDIKILVINHAHWDHDAGSATIKRLTGASYAVMDSDVAVVQTGGQADFHYGNEPILRYAPSTADRVLHDGDRVSLGGMTLVAHKTPGHTKGNATWTVRVTDQGKAYDAVIVGSWNVNPGYRLVNNATYPGIAEDYERTFRALKALKCDIFLGAHGSYFDMEKKVARLAAGGPNPFIDPAGYTQAVEERERAFRAELARQKSAPPSSHSR